MPIVTKTRPTPTQFYVRVAYLNERFPRGFRSPPTGKHADARDRKPLLLERLLMQQDPDYAFEKRTESKRGSEARNKGYRRRTLVRN
jgi:hypothetical protein